DAIVAALARYAVRGTRVVTAGADVDGLMSLRQALARRGMSVSMAWDGKQASELLVVVRPEVVVVDLGLPRRDGYGILARPATGAVASRAMLRQDAAPERARVIGLLDAFQAAERAGAEAVGRWIAACSDPRLRGGLRVIRARDARHAALAEARLRALGGEPAA